MYLGDIEIGVIKLFTHQIDDIHSSMPTRESTKINEIWRHFEIVCAVWFETVPICYPLNIFITTKF